MARSDPQVNFRIPAELNERLKEAAVQNNRTITAELVSRLESSFGQQSGDAEIRFSKDQLNALVQSVASQVAAHLDRTDTSEVLLNLKDLIRANRERELEAVRQEIHAANESAHLAELVNGPRHADYKALQADLRLLREVESLFGLELEFGPFSLFDKLGKPLEEPAPTPKSKKRAV